MSCEEAQRRLTALQRRVDETQRALLQQHRDAKDSAVRSELLALMEELDHLRAQFYEARRLHAAG